MDLSRFQQLDRLEPGVLRIAMVDVLSRERALARTSREALEDAIDSLINDGFGLGRADTSARRQSMLVAAGVLLKLAGASVAAIRSELDHRDDASLESVMNALLSRVRGSVDSPSSSAPPRPEPAPITGPAPLAHAPPASIDSAPNVPRVALEAAPGRENPALRFLNGLITDDIAGLMKRTNDAARASATAHTAHTAEIPALAWIELSVGDGVRFELSADALRELADDRRRDVLMGVIRARLDALYR